MTKDVENNSLRNSTKSFQDNLIICPDELISTSSVPFDILIGGITFNNGGNSTSDTRSRTKYFDVNSNTTYRFELGDNRYKIMIGWQYNSPSASGAIEPITQYNDTVISFRTTENTTCVRFSFAVAADPSVSMTRDDRDAILASVKLYRFTDESMSISNAPADASKVGEVFEQIGIKPIKYKFNQGYSWKDQDTIDFDNPWQAVGWKSAVVECSEGDIFTINGDAAQSAQLYAFTDSSGVILKRYGATSVVITNLEVTAPAGSAYLVLNTRGNYQSYYGRLPSQTNKFVEDLLEGILANSSIVSWNDMPQGSSSDYVLGWRTGYWTSNNTSSNSDTVGGIRYWTYISKGRQAIQSNYLEVVPPSGTTLTVREFASTTSSEQTNVFTIRGPRILYLKDSYIYRFTLYDLREKDINEYLTEEFINQIIIRPILVTQDKKARTGTFEFFTVDVERPLPFNDEVATERTDTIECVLRLPYNYNKVGIPTRLIFMAHGAHGYIQASTDHWYGTGWKKLCDDLLAAGYALFDANVLPDGTTDPNEIGYALGSPLYVNIIKKVYDYIQENYNVYPQIFCHGTSMGGVGATAFSHAYPQLVLAESSFAGRDLLRYIYSIWQGGGDARFARVWGYTSMEELNEDKFSHVEGNSPSLSLKKLNSDGTITMCPDRETDYENWLEFWGTLANHQRDDDVGKWIGIRRTPYKAWNSWQDSVPYTKLEEIFAQAYSNGCACPYYIVNYETGSHDDMCFGQTNNMSNQLIAWYKRWE